ncbi:2-dehydro-3-deoxyphosphogluconate aldolase/(4S)-4-hydroxy-2-oxoglutarate aldolase [Nocardioides thalensis]|uniref:2-dehydro-3-deoxy-phosphogluconate aldolase n=1 Tax=Nocardioides thalensis TaxID=1914755 RepID=A0A853BZF2_9ACTN|nr:bifunctional 4-hydroxy-2-oxoglutarate aldolase/2-dehydro-3-deoxy-phosphogluconate aldolase [Nocardioides thalensis]NYJ00267.1 2-dehydro-3-deoxyphosphogluconate aldolase/(4S)-4-hydroxy-2-oxoglutarate aldolase [Nocardioides thalensis]
MTGAHVLEPHRVVPVVVLHDAGSAGDLGAALASGGLPVAEVTFRTAAAPDALRTLAERGDLLVGAGTVLTPDQVDIAHDCGARFVVSPGLSADVVRRCQEIGMPVLPGTSTATEIMRALELGVGTVKFFPAEQCGGVGMLKALSAAFPDVRFVPTGGIAADSAAAYLDLPPVLAVGGSWMVPPDLVRQGRWDEVAALCAETVARLPPSP